MTAAGRSAEISANRVPEFCAGLLPAVKDADAEFPPGRNRDISEPSESPTLQYIGLTLSGLDAPLSITPPSAAQTKTVTPARLQRILDRTGASFFA